ncbi:MAG: hypothetical protein IKI57_02365 [Clostridia bacterium]|nr:hypothetical protein [Clostridia bacterium]
MKNILKIIFAILVITFALTGCGMKTYVGIIVSDDKKLKFEYTTALDDEAIDLAMSMNDSSQKGSGDTESIINAYKTHTDEERWEYMNNSLSTQYEDNGYKKTKYDQNGYKGAVYSKELSGTIDDYVGSGKNVDFGSLSEENKMFTKKNNHYYLYINLVGSGDNYAEAKSYKEQGADMDYMFYVTLPKPAIKSNATVVSDDELTYSWDLLQVDDIELEFDLNNKVDIVPMIIIGIVALFVVSIIGVSIYKMIPRKDNN